MTTPEWIVDNFLNGTSRPLHHAAEELQRMAAVYGDLSARFDAMRSQMSGAWTGPAATASAERADPLWTAVTESVELLAACAGAHGAQASTFETARNSVVPMPPVPEKPDVLGMLGEAVQHGPQAPFERVAAYREAVQAYEEAARHNVAVYDEYYWATTDNQNIPAEYPRPVWADGVDAGTEVPDQVVELADEDGGDGPLPGGGVPPGGGIGGTGGGPGGGLGGGPGGLGGGAGGGLGGGIDPGALTVAPPIGDPVSDPPPFAPPPGGAPPGGTTPNDAAPPIVHNPPPPPSFPDEPPPRNPQPPPVGGGVPGPGGRDQSRHTTGDQTGLTHAARAGAGADVSPLGMPFGGVGDRAGADQWGSGSQVGRGAGGAGGGQAAPGSLAGRGGGHGGFGMVPPGSANREEDKEHTRPEYLIEPDPAELFGSDQSVSSPVIGASWTPERYEDGDE